MTDTTSDATSITETASTAHPAATVILLRPATSGFEVLLLLRAKAIQFAGGSWVFPGGRIDQADYVSGGVSDREIPHSDEDMEGVAKVAAARETFEEAGLKLDPADFTLFSHWTTPLAEKKRFATWFLIGAIDNNLTVIIDDGEIVDYQWLSPADAIEKHHQQQLVILPPTYHTLMDLDLCTTIEQAISLCSSRPIPRILPRMIVQQQTGQQKMDQQQAAHQPTVNILYEDDISYKNGDLSLSGRQHRMTLKDKVWQYTNTP